MATRASVSEQSHTTVSSLAAGVYYDSKWLITKTANSVHVASRGDLTPPITD